MDLRTRLTEELKSRQRSNPRYSLRAYAQSLGTHHTTLARLIGQRKRLTTRTAYRLGCRLGLTHAEIARALAHEHTEMLYALVGHPEFRADCRWLAVMSGLSLDDVNVALHALIHARRLTLTGPHTWRQETC